MTEAEVADIQAKYGPKKKAKSPATGKVAQPQGAVAAPAAKKPVRQADPDDFFPDDDFGMGINPDDEFLGEEGFIQDVPPEFDDS